MILAGLLGGAAKGSVEISVWVLALPKEIKIILIEQEKLYENNTATIERLYMNDKPPPREPPLHEAELKTQADPKREYSQQLLAT